MYTEEQLKELGFKKEIEPEINIVNYVNEITSNIHLVLTPVLEEFFIWVVDAETRIIVDEKDIPKAVELAKIIIDVE